MNEEITKSDLKLYRKKWRKTKMRILSEHKDMYGNVEIKATPIKEMDDHTKRDWDEFDINKFIDKFNPDEFRVIVKDKKTNNS